jgi:hypothetical protein
MQRHLLKCAFLLLPYNGLRTPQLSLPTFPQIRNRWLSNLPRSCVNRRWPCHGLDLVLPVCNVEIIPRWWTREQMKLHKPDFFKLYSLSVNLNILYFSLFE